MTDAQQTGMNGIKIEAALALSRLLKQHGNQVDALPMLADACNTAHTLGWLSLAQRADDAFTAMSAS